MDYQTIEAKTTADVETVIVAVNNPFGCAYDVVFVGGDAKAKLEEAQAYYPKEQGPVVAMTWEQFASFQDERMRARTQVLAISQEEFARNLEVLPPSRWTIEGDLERFCCSEFTSGTWTVQTGRYKDLYATKLVNVLDENTWLTAEEIKAANSPRQSDQP